MRSRGKFSSVMGGIVLSLCLTCGSQQVLAEDMWRGVFTYQKKMADYGNPEAQVKLGEMYEEGRGTKQDYEVARQWYQKAADQGFAPARDKLIQLEARKLREAEERQRAEQAERERIAREKAAAEARARRARLEQERLAREAEQKRLAEEQAAKAAAEKARREEQERLARERARKAMEEMLSTPSAYTEEE